jgi:lauroyl/myristoyl acyltransferase
MDTVSLSKNPRNVWVSVSSPFYLIRATLLSGFFAPLFALSGVRRSVIRRNLALTLGRTPLFFRLRLGFNLFHDLLSLISTIHLIPSLRPRSRVHLEAMRGKNGSGPSLLLAAHFHNWEAQASALARLGVPLLGAARPLKAPWAERILRAVRAKRGVAVIHDDIPRRALRHLQSGGCFGFLWDQHSPASVQPGTFFGHAVSLNPLPLALLEKEPCPVYFGVWLPGNELRIIPLGRTHLERRYHRILETLVKRHPTYWYGFLHARFKTLGAYPGHRREGRG